MDALRWVSRMKKYRGYTIERHIYPDGHDDYYTAKAKTEFVAPSEKSIRKEIDKVVRKKHLRKVS